MFRKAIIAALFGLLAGLAMLLFNSGTAHADVHICIPGYTDDSGAGVAALKAAQGYPCDEVVQYSADLGLPGEVPAYLSIAEGAANTQAAVDRHPGEKKVVEGWSEGAIVANDYGNKTTDFGAKSLPSDVELIQDDNAYASTGALNHPLAPLVTGIVGPFIGLPPTDSIPPVPNSIHRYNEGSAWGNLAPQGFDIPTDIAMLASIPATHELNDPRDLHLSFDTPDGVHNEVFNFGTNPVSQAIPVDLPVVDQFFDAAFDPTNASEQPLP